MFAKDTKGLSNLVDELGLDIDIFRTIVEDNIKFTSDEQDTRYDVINGVMMIRLNHYGRRCKDSSSNFVRRGSTLLDMVN